MSKVVPISGSTQDHGIHGRWVSPSKASNTQIELSTAGEDAFSRVVDPNSTVGKPLSVSRPAGRKMAKQEARDYVFKEFVGAMKMLAENGD